MVSLICSVGNSSITELALLLVVSGAMYGCLICAITSNCSGDGKGGERGLPQVYIEGTTVEA